MNYQQVLRKTYAGDFSSVPEVLLCLDPGETTGYAVFNKGLLWTFGQITTVQLVKDKGAKQGEKVIDWMELNDLFGLISPTAVVCENYRIYAHKLERHSFSQVETLRLIGGIDMLCNLGWHNLNEVTDELHENFERYDAVGELIPENYHQPIPISYQMAAQAKGFITDDRLKEWDFWKEGMKHSRDAIRHGLYYLIITNRPKGGK